MGGFAFGTAVVVAAVFLVSGFAKIGGGSLAADLAAYRLLPRAVVGPVALLLPWVEVLVGVCILGGFAVMAMLTAAVVLLAAFTVGMAVNLIRGRVIDCGCRGAGTPISWGLVGTDAALLVATVAAMSFWAVPVVPTLLGFEERLSSGEAVAVLIVVAVLALLVRLGSAAVSLRASVRAVEALEPPVVEAGLR